MESRLKERLTGAAILVALIVLIVPEVFEGRHGATRAVSAPIAKPLAPVRSYTIDLGRAPVVPMPESPGAARSPPAVAGAVAETAGPAGQSKADGASEAAASQSEAANTASESRQGETRRGWSVQLGLFSKAVNAQRQAHSAQDKGFDVSVARVGERGLYRVAVAGLTSRAAAEQVSHRLHDAGLPGAILGPR